MNSRCPFSGNKNPDDGPVNFNYVNKKLGFNKVVGGAGSDIFELIINDSKGIIADVMCEPNLLCNLNSTESLLSLNWAFQEQIYDLAIEKLKSLLETEEGVYDGKNSVGNLISHYQLKTINDYSLIEWKVVQIGHYLIQILHDSFIKSYKELILENSDITRLLKLMNPKMKFLLDTLKPKEMIFNNCYSLEIILHTIENSVINYLDIVCEFLLKNSSKIDFNDAVLKSGNFFVDHAISGEFISMLSDIALEEEAQNAKYDRWKNKFTHNITKKDFDRNEQGIRGNYDDTIYTGCALLYKQGGKFGHKNALLDFNAAIFKLFGIYLERAGLLK